MKNPSLPLTRWPSEDQDAWKTATAEGSILDGRGPAAHWAIATKATNIHHYGRWLAFLHSQKRMALGLGLLERSTRENVGNYVDQLKNTVAPVTVASSVIGLTVMLQAMAPEGDWQWLRDTSNALKRNARPQRDKRSRMLPSGEIYQAAIQHLEQMLETDLTKLTQVTGYRNALMLALLTACPMRLKNFTALSLNSTLIKRGDGWSVKIPPHEIKTKIPLEFEVPPPLAKFLEIYHKRVRPKLLNVADEGAMWLNCFGKRFSTHGVYLRFIKFTPRLLGKSINPHLLRDCAATTLATHSLDSAMAARGLLGHGQFSTTEKYYIHAQQLEASRKINDVLETIKNNA